MRILSHTLMFSLLFVFPFLSIQAQDLDDVTISGLITDSNKMPIPGAVITASHAESRTGRTLVTDDRGRFRFVDLRPGIYEVEVEAAGFQLLRRTGIDMVSGQVVQFDMMLYPAGVKAEVSISADTPPAIDTTRTVVGGTVTAREIEELPNINRNALDLVLTLGGVGEEGLSVRDAAEDRARPDGDSNNDPRPSPIESGIFSLSGGAAYSNNITIDGMDNNDDRLAQDRFQPPLDSIAEVQVVTNQFSAEHGRASGGRVNIRTRAGGKRFRGRAYLYFRDDNLNANTYNNNRRGLSRLPFTEYNPGFTFGGPVPLGYLKNRTFFFVSYDNANLADTTLIDTVVPVGANPNFSLPVSTGGSPRAEGTTSLTPGMDPGMVAPYILTVPTPSIRNSWLVRLDHNFSDRHNAAFTYQFGDQRNSRQFRTATSRLQEAILGPSRDTDAYAFSDNYVFSSNVVNQARFQFSRFRPRFAAVNPLDPVVLITLTDTLSGADSRSGTLIAGNSTSASNFAFPGTREETRLQFQETLTVIRGPHTFRFGVDGQAIRSDHLDLRDATGTFNFLSVRNFLNGNVGRYRRNFGRQTGQRNTYYGIFVQDELRIRGNVTLSFGLRFEKETIIGDDNNFGPRAAVAYSPSPNSVIRVGGGIFYNRVLLRTFDDANLTESRVNYDSNRLPGPSSTQNYVCFDQTHAMFVSARCQFLRQVTFPDALAHADITAIEETLRASGALTNTQTGFSTPANNLRRIDPNIRVPESYQFNIGYERDLGAGFAFEANYTFNRTVHLFREFNANPYNLPNGFRDYNDYLVNGFSSPTLRFVNGDPADANGVSTADGITTVNLASRNPSAAASSPIGRARSALLSSLGRRLGNGLASQIDHVASIGTANYNGLIFELRRRFAKLGAGFASSFRATYTLSKTEDDGANNTSNPADIFDFSADFGKSLQDRRHRFAFVGMFDLPWWMGRLKLSPVLRMASSAPFNISNGPGAGNDRNLDEVTTDRPNFSGDARDLVWRARGSAFPQSVYEQFSFAPIGSAGTLPRNAGRGPGLFLFDLNIAREFRFTERVRLRPNVEIGNVLNSTVFTFGAEFINFNPTDAEQLSSFQQEFLVPSRTLRNRQIRLGLRFDF